jgi:hypothetical protein
MNFYNLEQYDKREIHTHTHTHTHMRLYAVYRDYTELMLPFETSERCKQIFSSKI